MFGSQMNYIDSNSLLLKVSFNNFMFSDVYTAEEMGSCQNLDGRLTGEALVLREVSRFLHQV